MNVLEQHLDYLKEVVVDLEHRLAEKKRKKAFNIPDSSDTVQWIVSEGNEEGNGELGVLVNGLAYWYYKWSDPEPDNTIKYRVTNKREFGEVIRAK